MNYRKITKTLRSVCGALLAVALLAGPSLAVTVNLAAVPAQWTPPGGAAPVPMWAFINDPGSCLANPIPWDVGPEIVVPAGENLVINFRNCLSEATSVFIPGLPKATLPVIVNDAQGRPRVQSFDATASAGGGTSQYTWTAPREGTHLYQSGTFVAKHVPMGLYGAVIVRGAAYPAADQEEVLVYSEIDPDLNNAGVGARVNNYTPRYFLINGETYPNIENITTSINDVVMLRFVNAGLQTYVPTLQDLYMSVFAEDGNLMPYPLSQYQLELQAAKTMDVLISLGATGRHALYDRSLHLDGGGLLTFIQTQNDPPVAVDDMYQVLEGQVLNVPAPGVLTNDSDPNLDPLTAFLFGTPPPGILVFNPDGSFSYTPAGAAPDVEQFQYRAYDGIEFSNVATVSITLLSANVAPVAVNDIFNIPRNTPGVIDLLANDTDSDGTLVPATILLMATTAGPGSNAILTAQGATVVLNIDNTITYSGEGGGGPDYFWYTVNDDDGATSNQARVRVNRTRGVPAAAVPATLEPDGSGSGTVESARKKKR